MGALSSLHHVSTSLSLLTKPSLSLPPFYFLHPIRSLRPIASSSLQFNIKFAPPTPKPKPPPNLKTDVVLDSSDSSPPLPPNGQFFIPWIVRGDDGNLKLQAHPPAQLINALADAKTQNPKKKVNKAAVQKKKKEVSSVGNASVVDSPPPKLSKAARRFYNENFRDPPQRLSKVLAAAGGKFTFIFIGYFRNIAIATRVTCYRYLKN